MSRILFFGLLMLMSCNSGKSEENIVISETLKDFLDDMGEGLRLQNVSVLHSHEIDKQRQMVKALVGHELLKTVEQKDIVSKLMAKLFHNSDIDLDGFKFGQGNWVTENNNPKDDYLTSRVDYFGSINVSECVINKNANVAAYYVAVNWGVNRGEDFVIISKLIAGKWKNENIINVWEKGFRPKDEEAKDDIVTDSLKTKDLILPES